MAAFVKFHQFAEDVGLGVHNLNTNTLKVYLSNVAPDAAADAVKADLAEIAAGNGYTAGGVDTQNTYSQVGGVGACVGVDATITASGGTVGPFRYAVLYNDDAASDPLIGYWDYGSSITLAAGEPLNLNFATSLFTLT